MAQALCHLSIANVGSAVEEAAYLVGGKLYDERQGIMCDKSEKKWEVLYTHILAPEYAPKWVYDLEKLVNSLEQAEKQRNGQVLRKMMVVLPKEFTQEHNIALATELAQTFRDEEGMIVAWSVHDKGDRPHVHMIFPTRPLLPSGKWGAKAKKVYILDENGEKIPLPSGAYKSYKERTTDWDNHKNAEKWRQKIQSIMNRHLKMAGLEIGIDMRSYQRQGLDIIPTKRLTRPAYELEQRGIQTARGEENRQIREKNMQRQTFKLVSVLKSLAQKREQQETLHLEAEREALLQQKVTEWEVTSQVVLEHATQKAERGRPQERVLLDEMLQRRREAYSRGKHAFWSPSGWLIKTGKDWQSVRKRLIQGLAASVTNQAARTVARAEQMKQNARLRHGQPHHERTRQEEERSYQYAENVRIIRETRKLSDERNQQIREGKFLPERAFQPWQEEVLERSFQGEYEKGRPAYMNALLASRGTVPLRSVAEEPAYSHERTRWDEERSHQYAENIRRIREKRELYDERNVERRENHRVPERAFEPWQQEVLARSFQVEEEKRQPASLNARLVSQGIVPRSLEGEPHHERTRQDEDRSQYYAENIRMIREKRERYDERNQERREGNSTPERANVSWQEEVLAQSFQGEEEKRQPASKNALLFSRGRAPQVEHLLHYERTRQDEERSRHSAENVRSIRDKRKGYDKRNQERHEGLLLPERAFQPWQEEMLARSFQVEEEKRQPVSKNALLFSTTRAKVAEHQPPKTERAKLDRQTIVPVEERCHQSHEWKAQAPEHMRERAHVPQFSMDVHLSAYLTIVGTARKTLANLQHRLTQIGKEQLAPLRAGEKNTRPPIPPSLQRAIGDLLIGEENKQQAVFQRPESKLREKIRENQPPRVPIRREEHRLEQSEPSTTHMRPDSRRPIQKCQEKGRSP